MGKSQIAAEIATKNNIARKAAVEILEFIAELNRLIVLLVVAAMWLGSGSFSRAAVALNIEPSTVGNTYPGFITLNITGLTNGETVKVQTYLDLNSNGVVDAGEPLIDAFNLTDGKATVIGGITNISVPFDSNPATGEITASLSFAPTLENIVGQKIYRIVSNPSGAFSPVTAVLNVTNTALGQAVSGIVYSNGIAPLAHAVVVALTATEQNYVGATIADSSGHYYLTLNPGSYILVPTFPGGYYTDQSVAPMVTLTNGVSVTNNLVVTNGTVTISGQVYDAGNSNTLGGVFVQLGSGNLLSFSFTDTNGDYTAGVTSNDWKIQISPERLSRRGYVTPQGNALKVNATLGDVANADIALYKGNALFYGQLTATNTPIPNISIESNDGNQLLHGKSYTDADGNYAVVALVNTNVLGTNDFDWYCSPSSGDNAGAAALFADNIFNQAQNIDLTTNQAYLESFVGLAANATISGQLVNNSGVPISGVGVGASATINGLQYVTAFLDTDSSGDYSVAAANGQWYVSANNSGTDDSLNNQGYYDPLGYHVVTIPPDNAVVNITAYPLGTPFLNQTERISPTQFGFNLTGSAGFNYAVQVSTNLASGNWVTITTITNFPGNQQFIEDNQATNSQRFYRVLGEQ
jgi:hypothetical protein